MQSLLPRLSDLKLGDDAQFLIHYEKEADLYLAILVDGNGGFQTVANASPFIRDNLIWLVESAAKYLNIPVIRKDLSHGNLWKTGSEQNT